MTNEPVNSKARELTLLNFATAFANNMEDLAKMRLDLLNNWAEFVMVFPAFVNSFVPLIFTFFSFGSPVEVVVEVVVVEADE